MGAVYINQLTNHADGTTSVIRLGTPHADEAAAAKEVEELNDIFGINPRDVFEFTTEVPVYN